MPEFDRWNSKDNTTWVYRLFIKRLTHLNEMLWASIPALSFAQGVYRRNKKKDAPIESTEDLFKASGEDVRRLDANVDDWNKNIREFENWNRLNSLVALLSTFEVYLSSVVSLSIESDPSLLLSSTKLIDGVELLKSNNDKHEYFIHTEKVTKGTWTERANQLKKLFPVVPEIMLNNIQELDKMRILRNNVAHAFGRDIKKARSRGVTLLVDAERLHLNRLKKWMGLITNIVQEIDVCFLRDHIGEYESIYFYHANRNLLTNNDNVKNFRKLINKQEICQLRSKFFCEELIAYYESI